MSVGKQAAGNRWPAYVAAGPLLFFSGQRGAARKAPRCYARFDEVRGLGPGANSRFAWVNRMEGSVGAQAIGIYERYRELLAAEGGDLASLVRYHILQRDKRYFPVFDRIRRHYESAPPASTAVGVGRFDRHDDARLCVDAIALHPAAAREQGARAVLGGSGRHAAAAHFSHVIGAGPYLFLAGQIPVDTSLPGAPLIRNYEDVPPAGRFLSVGRSHEDARNGPIAAQAWFTYDLIRKHLEGVGSSLEHVLNLMVYLQDMRDFPTFHRVHEHFFPDIAPALTVVEVREVGHKGTLIEVEPTALMPGRAVQRAAHGTRGLPAHMSALVEAGGLAFLSGVIGTTAAGDPVERIADLPAGLRRRAGARDVVSVQTMAAIAQIGTVLEAAGHGLERIVQLTVFVEDIRDSARVERILASALGKLRPALTMVEVPRPSPVAGARVSLTAVAWLGSALPRAVA